jgi:hypothetical protein
MYIPKNQEKKNRIYQKHKNKQTSDWKTKKTKETNAWMEIYLNDFWGMSSVL